MTQAPPYVRRYSFTDFASGSPSSQPPGVKLDAEFDAISLTANRVRENLSKIQRDDGALRAGSVGIDQLATTTIAALTALNPDTALAALLEVAAAVEAAQIATAAAAQLVQTVANTGVGRVEGSWFDLSSKIGQDGDGAIIPLTDTGTHSDPVTGVTVPNSGTFRYSASPAGWSRIAAQIAQGDKGDKGDAGTPGGDVMAIGLFSAIATIPAVFSSTMVRTSGYTQDGIGAAFYTVDPVQTPSDAGGDNIWRRQDAGGRWWTLYKGQTILDTMFGAIHDAQYNAAAAWNARWTGFDCQPAIQAMIDWAHSGSGISNLRIVAGAYRIGKMIHIGYGNKFHSINLTGAGKAYFGVDSGTMCGRNFAEPAFNVAGARNCIIERMSFCGVHKEWIDGKRLANIEYAPVIDDTISSNWHDPAIEAALGRSPDDRYAPDCAIVVDGFAGLTKPSRFYTDPAYPLWGTPAGSDGGYGLAGGTRYFSSGVSIKEVGFVGEQSGVITQPSGADGNGDFIHVTDWSANYSKRVLSLSQTQARSSSLNYGAGGSLYEPYTTRTHGKQTGQVVASMNHVSISGLIQMMSVSSFAETGPVAYNSFYGEAVYRIGDCAGSSSTDTPVIFRDAKINFDLQGAQGRPIPATVWGRTGGGAPLDNTLVFEGGSINSFRGFLSFMGGVSFHKGTLINGTLGGAFTGTISSWLAAAYNVTAGGVVAGQMRTGGSRSIAWDSEFNPRTIDTGGLDLGRVRVGEFWKYSSRARCIPWPAVSYDQANNSTARRFVNPRYIEQISKSDITLISTTPGATSIEIQCSKTYPKWQAEMRGGARGDLMYDSDTGMTFAVKDATWSGSTVTWTLVAYNGMKLVSGAMQLLTSFSVTSGSFQAINARRFSPDSPTIGSFTDASGAATAIGNDQATALATGQIVIGDRLYVDPPTDNWISETASDVTAVDLAAKTLSLSGTVNTGKGGRRAITLLSRTI